MYHYIYGSMNRVQAPFVETTDDAEPRKTIYDSEGLNWVVIVPQGGNKSTLAFRNDIGIPGYTGFNPSSTCLPPQLKGNTVRTGASAFGLLLASQAGPDSRQQQQ